MIQQQLPTSPADTSKEAMSQVTQHLAVSFRQLRTIVITIALFLGAAVAEWLFGRSLILASFSIILSVFFLFVLDVVLAVAIGWLTAEPMAIHVYLHEVQKEQKRNSRLYTPLSALKNLYETPINYLHNDAAGNDQSQDVRDLVRRLRKHLLILGLPGAGKTITLQACQYAILERRWNLALGRNRIPVYVPMREYNVFLEQNPPDKSILAYLLHGNDVTGVRHLKPYLERLAKRGRILFLCDGLNEIDAYYLNDVCAELTQMMQSSLNLVVMTCRELDYREQPALQGLIDSADEVLILPLKLEQMQRFVEQYIYYSDPKQTQWNFTPQQLNGLIKQSRLSYTCTNPMMLVTLMETINEMGPDVDIQTGTRGRLLGKFVTHLVNKELKRRDWEGIKEEGIVLFLSQVAFTARRKKFRNAIKFVPEGRMVERGAPRTQSLEEVAAKLQLWLDRHMQEVFLAAELAQQNAPYHPYTDVDVERYLTFAQSAVLISISPNGILSFRHELIAEYFVAHYLNTLDNTYHGPLPFGNELVADDIGSWSEPVAIWAGMSENPMELARRLANLGQSNVDNAYNALSLSLICAGVVWSPPRAQDPGQGNVQLPQNVTNLLVAFVPNPEARAKLAAIINRRADEGGVEVYRSLLPLIMDAYIDDLLLLLDKKVVPDLLFDYLRDAIDTGMPKDQIERLIHILGRFGAIVIARAEALSKDVPQNSVNLRTAAIAVLGRTNTLKAVDPLVVYLSDSEQAVVEAAVNALVRLGPNVALYQMIEELRSRTPAQLIGKIHWAVLAVLEGLLTQSQCNPKQYEQIITALLQALASNYIPPVQQKAMSILLRQATPPAASQDERWKYVVGALIRSLVSGDEQQALNVMQVLKQVGQAATALLVNVLNTTSSEVVRKRIIEVLGAVRDLTALPTLLPFLADASPLVREQVTIALRLYTPESIAPLISIVLSHINEEVARNAAHILEAIGEPCAGPVIQALLPIVAGRTKLLVELLVQVHDPRAIRPLITLLRMLQKEPELGATTIWALSHFADKVVVPPLLEVLINWGDPLCGQASKALNHLGELAFDELLAALDGKQDKGALVRVRNTLLTMNPFLDEQLLNAFKDCSNTQAQQIVMIFQQKGDTAPFLVKHLSHSHQRVRDYVFQILDKMPRESITPPLLEALKNPKDHTIIARLLVKQRENIPLLVNLLSDAERSSAAYTILLEFGTVVIPSLVPGLDHPQYIARKRAQDILVTLVRREPELQAQQRILEQVVDLFGLLPPSPGQSYAWEGLVNVLTNDVADMSIPALARGLEDAKVRAGAAEALVRLVHKQDVRSTEAKESLLAALKVKERREGAASALVRLGAEVVQPVSDLVFDKDVSLIAQEILSRIGAPALTYVWENYRSTDRNKRDASQRIFENMTTESIKDKLIEWLTRGKPFEVEMANALLTERILAEGEQRSPKMSAALLEHVQKHQKESSNLRIIALLLMLPKDVFIHHLRSALYQEHQEWLTQMFLLLDIEGGSAQKALSEMLHDPNIPAKLLREVVSVMGIMGLEEEVGAYATRLSKYTMVPNQNNATVDFQRREQLEVSQRALGGLLAGGKWNVVTLQDRWRRTRAAEGALQDLYSVLLGGEFSSRIKQLQAEQDTHEDEKQRLRSEISRLERQVKDQQRTMSLLQNEKSKSDAEVTRLASQLQRLQTPSTSQNVGDV